MSLLVKSVRVNIASLFSLQIVNYLVPLAVLPWITRALGPDGYGKIGFAIAVCAYLAMLVDYGFNLSATRLIAINRDDRSKCSQIFWATLGAKLLLAVIAFVALLLLITFVPRFTELWPLLLIGYLSVIGAVLTPVWYYQGMEKMSGFAAVNASVKLLSVPLIFVLVNRPEDTIVAISIQAGVLLVSGAINFFWLLRQGQLGVPKIRISDCLDALRSGSALFIAQSGMSLYTSATVVILGLAAANQQVAYFVAAYAIMRAIHGLINPITAALYPRVSHLMSHDRAAGIRLLRGLLRSLGAATAALSLLLYFAAPATVSILFGDKFSPAADVLQWLSPTVFIIALSNLFGVQTMLPLGHARAFSAILLSVGGISVFILVPLSMLFGASGAAISVLATEIGVTTAMAFFIWKKHPEIFQNEEVVQCTTQTS